MSAPVETAPTTESVPEAVPVSSTGATTRKKGGASKKTGTTKKPATTKAKIASKLKATTSKAVKPAASGRPSWKEIIKECIAANKEDARQGVSRLTIKKFAEEKYKLEVTGTNLSQLNRAIASGVESGLFTLPKGPSGKVKLAPKAKPSTSGSKENSKPPSKNKAPAATKTGAVKKPAVKSSGKKTTTTTAPKKTLAGKGKATTTKKTTAGSKRGTAKTVVTGTTAAAKAAGTRKAAGKRAAGPRKATQTGME